MSRKAWVSLEFILGSGPLTSYDHGTGIFTVIGADWKFSRPAQEFVRVEVTAMLFCRILCGAPPPPRCGVILIS